MTPAPKLSDMGDTYSYLVIPLDLCLAAFGPSPGPDAFLAQDAETNQLRRALEKGYRWVRTEGDRTIWERTNRWQRMEGERLT